MAELPSLSLDVLERESPGRPPTARIGGVVVELVPATRVSWPALLAMGSDWAVFVHAAVPAEHRARLDDLPTWKVAALIGAYRQASGLCETPEEDQRLATLVTRYGKAIEYDLAGRVDLGEAWRARRWRYLLNLIDQLPRDSAYIEAFANDDLAAEQIVDRNEPPARPRLSEWSPVVELLTALLDSQRELIQVVAWTRGAKIRSLEPLPRPLTAVDRVRRRRRDAKHRALTARLLPHTAQSPDSG